MQMKRTKSRLALAAGVVAVTLVSLALVACGGSSDGDSEGGANGVDRAFAIEMIDHHEMAIKMAKIAEDRASKPQVRKLAAAVIVAQQSEIDQLKQIDKQLADENVEIGELGLSDSMMGMNMDDSMLMRSKKFDRAFIDMMIKHHQGAIRMARVELAEGKDPQLRELAQAIIRDQSTEIEEMNAWRMAWYGKVSPAGGVPDQGEAMDEETGGMEGMGH